MVSGDDHVFIVSILNKRISEAIPNGGALVIDFDSTTPESQEGISLEIRGGDRIFGLFADGWKCTNWSKGVFFTRTFKEAF